MHTPAPKEWPEITKGKSERSTTCCTKVRASQIALSREVTRPAGMACSWSTKSLLMPWPCMSKPYQMNCILCVNASCIASSSTDFECCMTPWKKTIIPRASPLGINRTYRTHARRWHAKICGSAQLSKESTMLISNQLHEETTPFLFFMRCLHTYGSYGRMSC